MEPDIALFSESNARFVVSVAAGDAPKLERAMAGHACRRIGTVIDAPQLRARHRGRGVIDVELSDLRTSFRSGLGRTE